MHVLVVEDESPIRQLLSYLLLSTFPNVRVTLAGTGAEAIRAGEAEAPDLVLLDLGLPDMTGFDVIARLRQSNSPTRFVVVTAEGFEAQREHAARLGAAGFVTKPFDSRELRAKLREVVAMPHELYSVA